MSRTLLAVALLTLLAACSAERTPATASAPASDTTAAAPGDTAPPAADTPPVSPAPPASDTPPAESPASDGASFLGYGDVRFGTVAAEMEKAWGGKLTTVGKDANAECYFMTPTWVKVPAEFNFMISGGKFARFGTQSSKYVAPGGGAIGMTKAEILKRYAGAVEARPHKYTDGEYLRIKDPAGGAGVLVFETDGKTDAAKVTAWRVGLPPEVDYVEGCS
jgi:hypothetical protein